MNSRFLFSRRAFLAGATSLAITRSANGETLPRTATLDWALLETLLALGSNVVAGPELRQFREVAVEPAVPETVADLGLRGLPNLETLSFAKPDIIFNSNFYAWADPLLSGIAPTHNLGIYLSGEDPYVMAQRATMALGKHLDITSKAETYVAGTAQRLVDLRATLATRDRRAVLPINLGDSRHYRVFGSDSMFGSTLKRLGLENAWTGQTAYSAAAPMGIETLASMPDAWIILIPPHPLDAITTLERSAFWSALPVVREKRVITLGSINPYGALPAARRFAEELAKGLTDARNG
ncbi:ABC transporter substrate-binding protein [Agrobacterium sp. BA1120]|uniref:ABC transporter substrate-binding protein n=1 Tax=Agrobacterium sp. BA1120 TaxID=3228927 RepID=UPI00336AA2B4